MSAWAIWRAISRSSRSPVMSRCSPSQRGRAHLRTVSGAVEVGIARGVALEVDAEAMSGTVHSDIPLNDVPGRQSAGDRKVVLTVRSVSGNILVTRRAEAFAR